MSGQCAWTRCKVDLAPVQEQAVDSSGAPLDYEGRIMLDLTLLDVGRLEAVLETGRF